MIDPSATVATARPPAPAPAVPDGLDEDPSAVRLEVLVVAIVCLLPLLFSSASVNLWPGDEHARAIRPDLMRDSASLIVTSVANSALVIYVIHRSRAPASLFGLSSPRPTFGDLGMAVALLAVAREFWRVLSLWPWLWATAEAADVDPAFMPRAPGTPFEVAVTVLACAANGFAEELVMRGYFTARFAHLSRSRVGAVLLSTALFAGYHSYQGRSGVAFAVLFGLLAGIVFVRRPRLAPLVLAHAALDVLAYLRW